MSISYIKLWHILLDRGMKKKDLEEQADLSHYVMKKLARNDDVSGTVLNKISRTLGCSIEDIVEYFDD